MRPDIVVMTLNAATPLAECLHSLRGVGPIWVVDSQSQDATVPIALAAGAQVVPFVWDGRYPKKKQWCLDNLPFTGDWVLFVDADERLTPALVAELAALPERPHCAAYFTTLRPRLCGRTLRFGRAHHKITLLNRHRARFLPTDDLAIAEAWEVEGHYQPHLDAPAGRLVAPMLHELANDAAELVTLRARYARYARWGAAMELRGAGGQWVAGEADWRRRLAKTIMRLAPRPDVLAWLDSAILRLGVLDGRAGLLYARVRAEYYAGLRSAIRDRRQAAQPAE